MTRFAHALLAAFAVASAFPEPLLAQPQKSRPSACSLLTKEEVKRHLPWKPMLDQMPVEEERIGASGSSCNYPTVHIQVLAFSQRTLGMVKKKSGVEAIRGVGDEAYLYNNRNQYAELYVKAGDHLLTLQADFDGRMDSVKPGLLNLGKTLAAKLRGPK